MLMARFINAPENEKSDIYPHCTDALNMD